MTVLGDPREHTDAVLAHLSAAADGWLVGDGKVPDGAGWQTVPGQSVFVPYVIVWPTPGGGPRSDSIVHDFADLVAVFQVTSVGRDRQQAEWVRGASRVALLGPDRPTLPGRRWHIVHDLDLSTVRDDDIDPPIWSAPDRYRIFSTPEEQP